jgi:hypothetical protein
MQGTGGELYVVVAYWLSHLDSADARRRLSHLHGAGEQPLRLLDVEEKMKYLVSGRHARRVEDVQDMVEAPAHDLLDGMSGLQPAARASGSRAQACSTDLPSM